MRETISEKKIQRVEVIKSMKKVIHWAMNWIVNNENVNQLLLA